jgi:hypothetical protein
MQRKIQPVSLGDRTGTGTWKQVKPRMLPLIAGIKRTMAEIPGLYV